MLGCLAVAACCLSICTGAGAVGLYEATPDEHLTTAKQLAKPSRMGGAALTQSGARILRESYLDEPAHQVSCLEGAGRNGG